MKKALSGLILSAMAITMLASGCSADRHAQLVGKYKGELTFSAVEQEKNPMVSLAKAFVGDWSLELKDDDTYKLDMSLMGMKVPVEGKWSLNEDTVELNAEKVMGMTASQLKAEAAKKGKDAVKVDDMSKPMTFTASSDNKQLSQVKKGDDEPGAMIFTKVNG